MSNPASDSSGLDPGGNGNALSRAAWPAGILATIVGNACPMMQPLLVGIYVERMQLGVSAAGYVSAAELTAQAVATIVIARSIERRSLVMLGVVAGLVFAIANVVSIHATSLWMLVLSRMTVGGAAGMALAVGSAVAARTAHPERVFGLAFAGITFYGLMFFPGSAALLERFGPAGLYWTKALLGVVAALTVGACLRNSRRAAAGERRMKSHDSARIVATGREGATHRFKILACGFLLYVGHGAVWTYEERMGVSAGLSAMEIGQAFGLASLAGLVGALIAAVTGPRYGRVLPQLVALGLSVAAALLIVTTQGVFTFTVSACLIAVAWFYGVPYLAGVASALDSSGRLAGELSAFMSAGIALGPFVGATIVSDSFAPIGWTAAAAYVLCCLLMLGPSRKTDAALREEQQLSSSIDGRASRSAT
jgi:predicted MFS family arabinose efflux permease